MKPNETSRRAELSPSLLVAFIYLWPFFGVWSWNASSWSGSDRNGFNRFNGIVVLCFLDFIALLTFLPGWLSHTINKTGAIAICIVLLAAHWAWLDGPRGERLRQQFRLLSPSTRLTVRLVSGALFGGTLLWFFASVPPSGARG